MIIKKPTKWSIKENDVTSESIYEERRSFIKKLGIGTIALPTIANAGVLDFFKHDSDKKIKAYGRSDIDTAILSSKYSNKDLQTPEDKVLTYNNFYEFGIQKADPEKKSEKFITDPWSVEIDGLVNNPFKLHHEDLLKKYALEERIYHFRCVEAWSMNIPWIGFPLSALIKEAAPKSEAKYIAFETLYDPKQMPGQASPMSVGGGIDYPYVEGLRLDEAMCPLTLISVGLYGQTLAPQSGAPLRLVVPWKYGFKSIKSIVRITLTDKMPPTTWNKLSSKEYGFFANVNPEVNHPRWSQAEERFIGDSFRSKHKDTEKYNGYEDEVAKLYKGMDLTRYF